MTSMAQMLKESVILEPPKIKSDTVATVSPSISHEVMGPDASTSNERYLGKNQYGLVIN